jgi:hypothetical protein
VTSIREYNAQNNPCELANKLHEENMNRNIRLVTCNLIYIYDLPLGESDRKDDWHSCPLEVDTADV